MTRVLGIDPGLTRLGMGIVELLPGRKLEFVHVEVLTSAPDTPLERRLLHLGSAIERILAGPEKPAAIALERVFAQSNLPSVMGVAQISGIVLYHAAKYGVPITMYTPNEVKSQVTGYGAADKTQVTQMVTKILRLAQPPKPADAADALALAITHAWQLSRGKAAAAPTLQQAVAKQLRGRAQQQPTAAQLAWQAAEAKNGRRRQNGRR
ncbi:crossover junction endodeoxyribonuclease RuvC [Leucobacter sp. OH2974_COT-288]|nr:crossover junction endodeoxyribonuclease RuvC [Leucobacter sp. OH2974_COT-288]